jgi:hypothetical protein
MTRFGRRTAHPHLQAFTLPQAHTDLLNPPLTLHSLFMLYFLLPSACLSSRLGRGEVVSVSLDTGRQRYDIEPVQRVGLDSDPGTF